MKCANCNFNEGLALMLNKKIARLKDERDAALAVLQRTAKERDRYRKAFRELRAKLKVVERERDEAIAEVRTRLRKVAPVASWERYGEGG